MKLGSQESTDLLRAYQIKNDIRGLAIKLLLAKGSEVKQIHAEAKMNDAQMKNLARVIKEIRYNIEEA